MSSIFSGQPTRRRVLSLSLAGAGAAVFAPALIGRARAETVVRIGQIEALTGPSSPAGIRGRDGAILAVEDINAAGGIDGKFRLEVAPQDMANDPKQAVTLFRQFASDSSVVASVGPTNSVGFVPIVPIAGQVGLALVGDGSGAPLKQWNAWAYRINPVAASAVPVVLKKLVPKLGIKRMAVLYDQTQDGQAGDAEICKTMAGRLGYEIVAYEAFRAGDQDFSPQLATIRNARPDMIYSAAAPGELGAGLLTNQGYRVGPAAGDRLRHLPGHRRVGRHQGPHQGRLYLDRPGRVLAGDPAPGVCRTL